MQIGTPRARVCVVIAAKNEQERIAQCIEATLELIETDDELVVVNDGSTDRTAAILEALRDSDSRLSVITHATSQGRAAARNVAIKSSSAQLIAIQDADDLPIAGRFSALRILLSERPDLVAVGGQCVTVDPRFGAWRHARYPTSSGSIAEVFSDGRMAVCHTGSMIRRSALETSGLYNPRFERAQDLDLFRRLSSVGPMLNSPEVVVFYTHSVFLQWKYWYTNRVNHDRVIGRSTPTNLLLIGRYSLSHLKRLATFLLSHRSAESTAKAVKIVDNPR